MPNPFLVEVAIAPKLTSDLEKLDLVLAELVAEDVSFVVSTDRQSGQTILKGTDEFHLDSKIDTLRRTHGFDLHVGAPYVSYREKLLRRIEIDETYKKQSAGTGTFARVKILFESTEQHAGSNFESRMASGTIPKEYIAGIEKGIESVTNCGILAGFPVMDVKVTLLDASFHDNDSSAYTFEIYARAAFQKALHQGGCVLLEPIMTVAVTTPEDYVGSVTDDLLARRSEIQAQDRKGAAVIIKVLTPLVNMFGYANQLRFFSQGRATFCMQFSHFAPVLPPDDNGLFPPAVGMRT